MVAVIDAMVVLIKLYHAMELPCQLDVFKNQSMMHNGAKILKAESTLHMNSTIHYKH